MIGRYLRAAAATFAITLACFVANSASAQDITYHKRFIEELTRNVPPVFIAAPTATETAAPRAPAAMPIPISEAKTLMGLDALGPDIAAHLPGGKLGIVDLGFAGLQTWLASHPDEAKITTYIGSKTGKPDPAISDPQTVDHGYWVYRIARAVLPNVPIELYLPYDTSVAAVTQALLNASVRGVVVINMSLGDVNLCQLVDKQEDEFVKNLRLALVQRESFLFIAEGNSRDSSHTWMSADVNNNGYVDFRTAAEAASNTGSNVDGARVKLRPGDNAMYLSWDTQKHPDAEYALELVTPQGQVLSSIQRKGPNPTAQCGKLEYNAKTAMPALLRVKRLAGPKSGVLMRVQAYGTAVKADFNGLQTALAYTLRDNPFVIYVGSFGKAADGKLSPSSFSDIGRDTNGVVAPHILGPGQLVIDGKVHQGTSFASPFLTALYATRVGYNLKNLVERTAGFDRFAPGVAGFERARWGVPDPHKVMERLTDITGPTKVTNVSHRVEGNDLVVRYSLSRCCMQSLTWYAAAGLTDAATHAILKDANGKALIANQQLRTEEAGTVVYPVEMHFPMSALSLYKDKSIDLIFGLRVRAWQTPPPGSLKVDEAPVYHLTRLGVNPPDGTSAAATADAVAAAKEPVPQKGSLAADVLEKLKATREYAKLSSYYEAKKKGDPAWIASAQGRAVDAYLVSLRSDAAATRAVDTGDAKYLEYAVGGTKVIDKGILPADLKSDPDYRAFIANAVAANIVNDKTFQSFLATLGEGEALAH